MLLYFQSNVRREVRRHLNARVSLLTVSEPEEVSVANLEGSRGHAV